MKLKTLYLIAVLTITFLLTGCTVLENINCKDNDDVLNTINLLSEEARQSNIYIKTTLIDEVFGPFEKETGGQGSGFVFKKDATHYYALTNFHVINPGNADRVEYGITLNSGDIVVGEIIAMGDESYDLTIISFPISDNDIPLTNIDPLVEYDIDDFILVIGNPGGLQNVVTTTKIEAYSSLKDIDYNVISFNYTMDARGNSGGAVIDLDGKLIGIITWQSDSDSNMKFAVPIEEIYSFLEDNDML